VEAKRSLGAAYARAGRFGDAVGPLTDAVRLDPSDGASHADLATALLRMGKIEEAATEYERAFRLGNVPLAAERHNDFGVALIQLGRREASIAQFQEALRLRPQFDAARANLARAQAR
jgi:Flp pilus assembly protein TadD